MEKLFKVYSILHSIAEHKAFNYSVAGSNLVVMFTPEQYIEMGIKLLIGIPSAAYMCFKIYHEFIKGKNNDKKAD